MISAFRYIPVQPWIRKQSAGGSGAATSQTMRFDVVPVGLVLLIERMTTVTDSAASTTLKAYEADSPTLSDEDLFDLTSSGNLDVADEASRPVIPGGSALVLRWTGGTAGFRVSTRVQGILCATQQIDVPELIDLLNTPAIAALYAAIDP